MTKKATKKNARSPRYIPDIKLVESRKNPKVLVLKGSGYFCCHESYDCGQNTLKDLTIALASDRKNFILNLAGVTVLDAVGVGVLATFIGKCTESGVKLVWCTARQRVKDKLLETKLIYFLPYYNTEEEALESFDK